MIGEYKSEEEILKEIEKEEECKATDNENENSENSAKEVFALEFWGSDSEEEIDLSSGESGFSFKARFEFWDNEVPETSRQASEFWKAENQEKKVDIGEIN